LLLRTVPKARRGLEKVDRASVSKTNRTTHDQIYARRAILTVVAGERRRRRRQRWR
jgi:hypothetical protein